MHPSPLQRLPQVAVRDSHMSYRAAGAAPAPTVLLLHGNPTSSWIWRHVLPELAPVAHAIAPDLIGFGQSGKPAIDYRFADHVRYLDAFVDALRLDRFYLLAQDWGTALAFHLAARFPERVRGLAFMEFIRPFDRWDDFHQNPQAREMFRRLRTPGIGEQWVLHDNVFIERILPGSIRRRLGDDEFAAYRAPFPTPASRRPIWRLPNELPIEGQPSDVHALLAAAHAALKRSTYPKLLFTGDPGALVSPAFAHAFAAGLTDARVVELGDGLHYLQEDHPQAIGRAVAQWIVEVESRVPA
jgi:haloalkane dehalogenase